MTVALRVTSPAPRDVWRALFDLDPDALVTQSPEWLDCICAAGGYRDASRLYQIPCGRRVVLPLLRRHGLSGSLAFEASPPHGWGIGGPVGDGARAPEVIGAILDDLAKHTGLRIAIRPNPLAAASWAAARPATFRALPRLVHVLDLRAGFESVVNERFDRVVRRGLRKAAEAGLEVESDSSGALVSEFYGLFEASIVRWAQQQNEPVWLSRWRAHRRDPHDKLALMAERMGNQCRILIARHRGRPAAAIVVLQGANAYYTRGVMDKELANPIGANFLLHRQAIEDACRAGCQYYHMGETGSSSKLARFKAHFGAEAHPYAEYRHERLPFTALDDGLRGMVKWMIGFKDA